MSDDESTRYTVDNRDNKIEEALTKPLLQVRARPPVPAAESAQAGPAAAEHRGLGGPRHRRQLQRDRVRGKAQGAIFSTKAQTT